MSNVWTKGSFTQLGTTLSLFKMTHKRLTSSSLQKRTRTSTKAKKTLDFDIGGPKNNEDPQCLNIEPFEANKYIRYQQSSLAIAKNPMQLNNQGSNMAIAKILIQKHFNTTSQVNENQELTDSGPFLFDSSTKKQILIWMMPKKPSSIIAVGFVKLFSFLERHINVSSSRTSRYIVWI